jgi:hypothetical protein
LINADLSLPFDQKNGLLSDYDHQIELMKQIRSRSGLDVPNSHRHSRRRTSSLEGYITGSSLLRTSGATRQKSSEEGSNGLIGLVSQ